MSKHLLFFSHAYLPENTSAVQRSAPLARYLADQGWTVHVVAASHAGSCEDGLVWNVPGPRAAAAPWRTAFWRMAHRVHACLFHGDSAAAHDRKLAEFLARPAITCAPSAWFMAEFDARKLAAQMSALLDGEEASA